MPKGKASTHRVTVKLDSALYDYICQEADLNERKPEQEIVYRLRSTVVMASVGTTDLSLGD